MKQIFLSSLFLLTILASATAQHAYLNASPLRHKGELNKVITIVNDESSSHIQGVAVDLERGFMYFSFTTKLFKTDLDGHVIGSVRGFSCHLGCLELDRKTGKLYASVEYKDDAIGQGISGSGAIDRENTFYIGIFDTEKIVSKNMHAENSGVFKTVYLPEVVQWYEGSTINNGKSFLHVYGCSGVDGISMGPQFGSTADEDFINIALGIYSETNRTDNDYQVLLQYRPADLETYAQPLNQSAPHHSGPAKAFNQYFVYTGNTNYGIQNLEYDPFTHYWFVASYAGKKSGFPNYPLFAIDGRVKAETRVLKGFVPSQEGKVLTLATDGTLHSPTGIYGWSQNVGSVGIESIGDGYFYIASQGTSGGLQSCTLKLYRWYPNATKPFVVATK